jgi:predicted nuclease of predicted toxin-antitoxin system
MRFLIDECLSIDLISVANQAGYEAQHVARVGKAGWKDWNVARHASDGEFVLVTNNASDFRRLYATRSPHAGLVIIIPNVNRAKQQQLFRGALDELAADPNTIWLDGCVDRDTKGFVLTGLASSRLPLETNLAGVFAIGDVRAGSSKRVAAAVGEGAAVVAQIHTALASQN